MRTCSAYLRDAPACSSRGDAGEPSVKPAGDGNINWVRRVRASATGERRGRLARDREAGATGARALPAVRGAPSASSFEDALGRAAPRASTRDGVLPARARLRRRRTASWSLEDLGDAERLDARPRARAPTLATPRRALARFLGARPRRRPGAVALRARFANDADAPPARRAHLRPAASAERLPALAARSRRARARCATTPALVRIADAAYARYLRARAARWSTRDVQAGNVLLACGGVRSCSTPRSPTSATRPSTSARCSRTSCCRRSRAATRVERAPRRAGAAYRRRTRGRGAATPSPADAFRYAGLELLRRTIGAARVPAVESDAAGAASARARGRSMRRSPADAAHCKAEPRRSSAGRGRPGHRLAAARSPSGCAGSRSRRPRSR